MRKIIVSLVLLWFVKSAAAQNHTPVQFQSILQAGLLTGESTSSYEVQTINGIKWKNVSAGVGIGIDDYVFRTIPLFADIRADVFKKKNTPFVFVDAGPQFDWLRNDQQSGYFYSPQYKAGFYFNAGAGYKITLFKKQALIFSAAFALKKLTETQQPYCDFVACPEQKPIVNNYTFRRLSLTAGWMIW